MDNRFFVSALSLLMFINCGFSASMFDRPNNFEAPNISQHNIILSNEQLTSVIQNSIAGVVPHICTIVAATMASMSNRQYSMPNNQSQSNSQNMSSNQQQQSVHQQQVVPFIRSNGLKFELLPSFGNRDWSNILGHIQIIECNTGFNCIGRKNDIILQQSSDKKRLAELEVEINRLKKKRNVYKAQLESPTTFETGTIENTKKFISGEIEKSRSELQKRGFGLDLEYRIEYMEIASKLVDELNRGIQQNDTSKNNDNEKKKNKFVSKFHLKSKNVITKN